MIFTRMIRSETRLTSNTFSIHFSATNTPTPAVPLLFPDQNSLYLESLPVIIRQWPPRYLVSWTQQRSTFLRDSVSTTSQTLPFRVFTLRVPTLKFLRCLLDLPQWPDPAPHTWEGAKPETPLTEIWFLPASPNVTSFVDSAMIVFGTKVFLGSPVLADIPTQIFDGLWDSAVPSLGQCALPLFLYIVVRQATIARMPNHRCVDGCHLALPPRLWQPLNPEVGDAV